MLRTLRPYQEKALQYLRDNEGGALFMQMRLGKTLVCIRYVREFERTYAASNPPCTLVVAPVEGLWAWKRELGLEGLEPALLTGSRKQRLDALWNPEYPSDPWYLINYEGFLSLQDQLGEGDDRWDFIILDESRRIANPQAKTTKALLALSKFSTARKIILAGEPAPESPLEYFTQLAFVSGSFANCKNYWQYRHNFFKELAPHEWVPIPQKLDRLKAEIRDSAFFLTRKQAGIKDTKVYEVRALELPAPLRKMYEQIQTEFLASLDGKVLASTKWVPVQYIWMHQLASGFLGEKLLWDGKIKQLVELLQGELAKEQVVVWFKYNAPLREVAKRLKKEVVLYDQIIGDDNRSRRENAINTFRDGKVRVLLCQIKCGKTAIDLSNSSTAIYFSNSYSLEERLQSEDRILNPAKRDPLLYLDLLTKDTVEEDITNLLQNKKVEAKFFRSTLLNQIRQEATL